MPTKTNKPVDQAPTKDDQDQPQMGEAQHALMSLGRMYAEAIANRPQMERQILVNQAEAFCKRVMNELGG